LREKTHEPSLIKTFNLFPPPHSFKPIFHYQIEVILCKLHTVFDVVYHNIFYLAILFIKLIKFFIQNAK